MDFLSSTQCSYFFPKVTEKTDWRQDRVILRILHKIQRRIYEEKCVGKEDWDVEYFIFYGAILCIICYSLDPPLSYLDKCSRI